ncbi:hypothetical protein BUE80_DR005684 [Diplocarpon rosae]|nr:hypothetical protein BUE80_DR005684 [Diplocarpon rosae]
MQINVFLFAACLLGNAVALQVSCESAGKECSHLTCGTYRTRTPCCGTEKYPTLECGGPAV